MVLDIAYGKKKKGGNPNHLILSEGETATIIYGRYMNLKCDKRYTIIEKNKYVYCSVVILSYLAGKAPICRYYSVNRCLFCFLSMEAATCN